MLKWPKSSDAERAERLTKALQAIAFGLTDRQKYLDRHKIRCLAMQPMDWQIAEAALGTGKHSSMCKADADYMGAGTPTEGRDCSYCWAMWFSVNGVEL